MSYGIPGSPIVPPQAPEPIEPVRLSDWLEWYIDERGLEPTTVEQMRIAVRLFERQTRKGVYLHEITRATMTVWLKVLEAAKLRPSTIKNYIKSIETLLRSAWLEERLPSPPRPVKVRGRMTPIPIAYTREEVGKLLEASKQLRGYDKRPLDDRSYAWSRAMFWEAAIRLAWDTAARRGDLLAFTWDQLSEDGVLVWQQKKTGGIQTAQLSTLTVEALRRAKVDDRLLPWPYTLVAFVKAFTTIRNVAGLTRGSFKWIRRASATNTEMQAAGAGRFQLGHKSQGVAEKHYLVPMQIRVDRPRPAELPE